MKQTRSRNQKHTKSHIPRHTNQQSSTIIKVHQHQAGENDGNNGWELAFDKHFISKKRLENNRGANPYRKVDYFIKKTSTVKRRPKKPSFSVKPSKNRRRSPRKVRSRKRLAKSANRSSIKKIRNFKLSDSISSVDGFGDSATSTTGILPSDYPYKNYRKDPSYVYGGRGYQNSQSTLKGRFEPENESGMHADTSRRTSQGLDRGQKPPLPGYGPGYYNPYAVPPYPYMYPFPPHLAPPSPYMAYPGQNGEKDDTPALVSSNQSPYTGFNPYTYGQFYQNPGGLEDKDKEDPSIHSYYGPGTSPQWSPMPPGSGSLPHYPMTMPNFGGYYSPNVLNSPGLGGLGEGQTPHPLDHARLQAMRDQREAEREEIESKEGEISIGQTLYSSSAQQAGIGTLSSQLAGGQLNPTGFRSEAVIGGNNNGLIGQNGVDSPDQIDSSSELSGSNLSENSSHRFRRKLERKHRRARQKWEAHKNLKRRNTNKNNKTLRGRENSGQSSYMDSRRASRMSTNSRMSHMSNFLKRNNLAMTRVNSGRWELDTSDSRLLESSFEDVHVDPIRPNGSSESRKGVWGFDYREEEDKNRAARLQIDLDSIFEESDFLGSLEDPSETESHIGSVGDVSEEKEPTFEDYFYQQNFENEEKEKNKSQPGGAKDAETGFYKDNGELKGEKILVDEDKKFTKGAENLLKKNSSTSILGSQKKIPGTSVAVKSKKKKTKGKKRGSRKIKTNLNGTKDGSDSKQKHSIFKDFKSNKVKKRGYSSTKLLAFNNTVEKEVFKKTKKRLTMKDLSRVLDRRLAERRAEKFKRIRQFLNSRILNYFLSLVIFVSIFGDDLRIILLPKTMDMYVDCVMGFVFVIFLIEIFSNVAGFGWEYVCSFMLFLDIFATSSIFLDMAWVSEGILAQYENGQSRGSGALRISELGTRVGRILRIMRLIRLMRLSKAIQKKDQGDASKVQDVNDVRQVQFDSRVRVLTKQFNKGFVEDQVSDYEADSPWRELSMVSELNSDFKKNQGIRHRISKQVQLGHLIPPSEGNNNPTKTQKLKDLHKGRKEKKSGILGGLRRTNTNRISRMVFQGSKHFKQIERLSKRFTAGSSRFQKRRSSSMNIDEKKEDDIEARNREIERKIKKKFGSGYKNGKSQKNNRRSFELNQRPSIIIEEPSEGEFGSILSKSAVEEKRLEIPVPPPLGEVLEQNSNDLDSFRSSNKGVRTPKKRTLEVDITPYRTFQAKRNSKHLTVEVERLKPSNQKSGFLGPLRFKPRRLSKTFSRGSRSPRNGDGLIRRRSISRQVLFPEEDLPPSSRRKSFFRSSNFLQVSNRGSQKSSYQRRMTGWSVENPAAKKPVEEEKVLYKYKYLTENIKGRASKKTDIILPRISKAVIIWNDRMIKKLIVLIMVMNCGLLFMGADFYTDQNFGYQNDIEDLGLLYQALLRGREEGVSSVRREQQLETVNNFIENLPKKLAEKRFQMLELSFSDKFHEYKDALIDTYRSKELKFTYYSPDSGISDASTLTIRMVLRGTGVNSFTTLFQLFNMIYLILIVMIAYFMFTKDSNKLVMKPLRNIARVLNVLLKQPLNPNINNFYLNPKFENTFFEEEQKEYSAIVEGISKMAIYLSYCYGHKDVEFIMKNLVHQKKTVRECTSSRVFCYMAIVEIEDFEACVERMGTRITNFLSEAVDIVARTSDRYKANSKLLKDFKFLIIWRLDAQNEKENFVRVNRNSSEMASLSVTTLIKIAIKLHRLKHSERYSHGEGSDSSSSRLQMVEEFSRYLKIGLHCGKLYQFILSNRVRTEVMYQGIDLAATKQVHSLASKYSTTLVMSQRVYKIVPECMKAFTRKIDMVKSRLLSKSYGKPQGLYSLDLSARRLDMRGFGDDTSLEYEKRKIHVEVKSEILSMLRRGAKNRLFMEDEDIQNVVVKKFEFRRFFRSGIDFYLLGAWDSARMHLERAMEILNEDGPTLEIMAFMKRFGFKKPVWWRGYIEI